MDLIREVHARMRLPSPAVAQAIVAATGASQGKLAREVGRSRQTVGRWLQGTRTPRGEDLERWVDLLEALRREAYGDSPD